MKRKNKNEANNNEPKNIRQKCTKTKSLTV